MLRQIMQQFEEEPDVDTDSLAFIQLKVFMLEKIALLEAEHRADQHAAGLN